jgi:peptide/nickel transport system substrate-binding protein
MKSTHNLFIAVMFGVALTLAACKPSTPENDPVDPEGAPERGDWLRIGISNDPDALHPFATRTAIANNIKEHLYGYLTEFNPTNLVLEPYVATELSTPDPTGTRYIFNIRPEAVWDDGKPVTGYDYLFSIKAMMEPLTGAPHLRDYFEFIQDVEVDPKDPKRFTVVTDTVFFIAKYALGGFDLSCKHKGDPNGHLDKFSIAELKENVGGKLESDPDIIAFNEFYTDVKYGRDPAFIFGCGPYKLEEWIANEKIVLTRKKDWWGDKVKSDVFSFKAYPDKLIYKTIKDRSAALQALGAGEIDILYDIVPEEFDRISKDSTDQVAKTCNLLRGDSYSYTYLGLNCRPPSNRKPYLTEAPVRRALAHLLNVDKAIETIHLGYGKRVVGPIPYLNPSEYHTGLQPIPFDIERAKAILDSAGWKDTNGNGIRDKKVNGKLIELSPEMLVASSSPTGGSIGAMFAEDALLAGVEIRIEKLDFGTISKRLDVRDFDIFGLGFNGSPIPTDLMQVFHSSSWSSGGSNYFGFTDSTADALIGQIRVTLDSSARKPLYWKFQEIVYREQPMIFMISPIERIIIHKRFRNQFHTVLRPGFRARSMWVPKAEQQFKGQ